MMTRLSVLAGGMLAQEGGRKQLTPLERATATRGTLHPAADG